jgi:hypothetical protein
VAHIIRDLVREEFDLSAILAEYSEERGAPPFHPTMMVTLLLMRTAAGFIRRAGSHRRARNGWISWR